MYATLEEALNAKLDITERIQSIDIQLAQRQAEVFLGASDEEYQTYLTWRAKATAAKAHMVVKLRRTKLWITKRREADAAARILKRGGETGLLAELFGLVKELVSNGAEISQAEQQLIDDVGNFLNNTK